MRFDADLPGEWTAEVISCWADPRSDFAVLTIAPRAAEPAVAAARFGRIGGDRAAVLAARAVGFPRFKLKTDDAAQLQYRDSHQADGSVAVLSNRREGTLELTVPPPERDPDPEVSPWEGMSGAAVWVGDRIVGVIAKHHRSDGLGRLAAAHLDLALADLDQGRRAELRTLLDLPETLSDVVPPSVGEWVRTAYQAQVRDIAPDRLLDREAELDELVGFCAGDQPYAWWQAGPWAGKSALMSWFVLHPPAGVDIVSFFVTARLAGQSDSDVCTDALIEQLAALTGESPATLLTVRARRGIMLRLLEDAANRSQEAGRRLLLVIDGLDEDSGTATGSSIAALLPRRPPPEVRILVASRLHPPIPNDVTEDHPLRTISPRQLAVSEHARDIERRAKHEIKQLLAGDHLQRDVLGLITAAGGGLTLGDLEQLTERPPFEIEDLLGGMFGRSVGSWAGTSSAGYLNERVYLLTHETLRLLAEQQYGASLAAYRDRLHHWADIYRQRSWPADTPRYLLSSYPRMLASVEDLPRLFACGTDHTRHNRMRSVTGGDALAFTEISTAQQRILAQCDPDLTSLALLALQRDNLTDRNTNIPTNLPAVWAMIGQPTRAEALANSIPHLDRRVDALAGVARTVAAGGDHDRAARLADDVEALTGQITDPDRRTWALIWLVEAAAAGGDRGRTALLASEAEGATRRITDSHQRTKALARLAEALASVGEDDRAARMAGEAEALTGQTIDPDRRRWTLVRLAEAVASNGDHDRATTLIGQIPDPDQRAEALAKPTQPAASGSGLYRQIVIADPDQQAEALARLIAADGDHDRAEVLTWRITNPARQALALVWLTETVAADGDHDRAVRLADETEALTGHINDPDERAEALGRIARILMEASKEASPTPERADSSLSLIVRARHLLAAALVTGSWTRVVGSLAHVAPSAITALADAVQVRWG
ncbi:MAG: hypothetical protein ACRDTG_25210 [Pseudonocardiaceae bacterium]